MESVNARQRPSFSFPELWYILLEFNSRKNRQIWRIEQDGKNALKFGAERTYFLSDVLGRGIHLAKGATIFFEHYNELPLSCTTFLTTFVRDCTSVHKNRFTTCAVFLSFHVNFVHIFPQPACLDSITFPAVCAFVALSTLIKKIRENRSVRNALKRNRRLERREWQARRIAQVWRKKKGWPTCLLKFQDSVQPLACERRCISGRRFPLPERSDDRKYVCVRSKSGSQAIQP